MPYIADINHCETSVVDVDVRHLLIDQMNKVHGHYCDSNSSSTCDLESSFSDAKASSMAITPSWNILWYIDREVCASVSPKRSP